MVKQQKLHFFSLGGQKAKFKVLEGLVSREGSLPGLQKATFSLCPHMARRKTSYLDSFHKDTNPIIRVPSSSLHLNLIISQRLNLQISSCWGSRICRVMNLGGGTIHYNAPWPSIYLMAWAPARTCFPPELEKRGQRDRTDEDALS
jgi:hypothetical protein